MTREPRAKNAPREEEAPKGAMSAGCTCPAGFRCAEDLNTRGGVGIVGGDCVRADANAESQRAGRAVNSAGAFRSEATLDDMRSFKEQRGASA